VTREQHIWDRLALWYRLSCCFSGDISGLCLPFSLLRPAHQGKLLSYKAPQNVTRCRTCSSFLVPMNLMTVPRGMLQVCQIEEAQRHLNCSFQK